MKRPAPKNNASSRPRPQSAIARAHRQRHTPRGDNLTRGSTPKEFQRTIRIWDLTTNKVIRSINSWATELVFAPNGKWLATIGPSQIWDVETGNDIAIPDLPRSGPSSPRSCHAVAFSPDSRFHAWVASHDGIPKIHVFESATGREVGRYYDGGMHITAVAFSPDGRRLASGHVDSTV